MQQKVRLTEYEKQSIKETFEEIFKKGKIYLFGSRIDVTKKGGDIDLYIDLPYKLSTKEWLDKKGKFKLKLYDKIGEQKIDIVLSKDKNSDFEKEILKTKVEL
jgi:predicted nucleotidyltransferase